MNIFIFICLIFYIISKIKNGFLRGFDFVIILGYIFLLFKFDSLNNYLLIYITILTLLSYTIVDILYGIRITLFSIPLINQLILFYDECKKYFKNKFRMYIYEISEIFLVFSIISIYYIQIRLNLPYIDFELYRLIDILGFIIAILTMYGIYIAFLQYLTSDLKTDIYLGQSKVNYLIKKSFFYYITQSKSFIFMLLCSIFIPIIVKTNIIQTKYLNVLWQSIYLLLLIIYIFLLNMSLKIIRIAFSMKVKSDKYIKNNIKIEIEKEYTDIFWLIYKERYSYDIISDLLSEDFKKLDTIEYEDFIKNIFIKKYFEETNLYYTISKKIESDFKPTIFKLIKNYFATKFGILDNTPWLKTYQEKNQHDLENEWKYFYDSFKKFVFVKWNVLTDYQKYIPNDLWFQLIELDINILDKIVISDSTQKILSTEYYMNQPYGDIRFYLFELLINRKGIDINKIIEKIKFNETLYYNIYFLEFRLEKIFEKYKREEIDFIFSNDIFKNNKHKYSYNSMMYSKICFNYLCNKNEDFIQNEKTKDIILSMNEEYRLAFMLFKILYLDNIHFKNDIKFYSTEIKNIMNYNNRYHEHLFETVKSIIKEQDFIYGISEEFLEILWKTRTEVISDFVWFEKFIIKKRISYFKILYIQHLLSDDNFLHYSRFNFKTNKEEPKINFSEIEQRAIEFFCHEYLLYIDKIPTIFKKETSYYIQNNLQLSVEYILYNYKVNLSNVIKNIPITGLLCLEWIFKHRYYRYTSEVMYSDRMFFEALTSNTGHLMSICDGIVEFYVIKIVDSFYQSLYEDHKFIEELKNSIKSKLNSCNETIENYVESVVESIRKVEKISILDKEKIIFKVKKLLLI